MRRKGRGWYTKVSPVSTVSDMGSGDRCHDSYTGFGRVDYSIEKTPQSFEGSSTCRFKLHSYTRTSLLHSDLSDPVSRTFVFHVPPSLLSATSFSWLSIFVSLPSLCSFFPWAVIRWGTWISRDSCWNEIGKGINRLFMKEMWKIWIYPT